MNWKHTCLFGGTIFAAGVASADAATPSFVNEGTVAVAYAYDYDSYTGAFDFTYGFSTAAADSGSIAFGASTASWSWDAGAGTWGASLSQGDTEAAAYATIASLFSITSDLLIEISWDVSAISDLGGWQLLESDDLAFQPDERIDGVSTLATYGTAAELIGLSGTTTLQLRSDKFYQLAFDLFGNENAATASAGWVSARLVPAPGAAGLLALAGLAARRRRG